MPGPSNASGADGSLSLFDRSPQAKKNQRESKLARTDHRTLMGEISWLGMKSNLHGGSLLIYQRQGWTAKVEFADAREFLDTAHVNTAQDGHDLHSTQYTQTQITAHDVPTAISTSISSTLKLFYLVLGPGRSYYLLPV